MPLHNLRQTFHGIFHSIPRNLPRTSTPYHGTLTSLTPTLTLTLTLTYSRCRGHWGSVGVAMTCSEIAMECRGDCHGGCHGTYHPWHATAPPTAPWNPMPRHGMSWVCHGMSWVVPWPCHKKGSVHYCPFSRHAVACRGTTCGKTFHGIFHGIQRNLSRHTMGP